MARVDLIYDEHGQPVLDVVLSFRNLVALLSKLMTPGSHCRFDNGCVPDGIAYARFRGESDEIHYNTPERRGVGPGEMHPIAEAVLTAVRSTLAARAAEPSGARTSEAAPPNDAPQRPSAQTRADGQRLMRESGEPTTAAGA